MGKIIVGLIDRISNIIKILFKGAMFAALPALVWYGGNQTSLSRIKKYGAESPEGIEAVKIANGINIVCGIILGVIALIIVIYIIKALLGKVDLKDKSSGYTGNYSLDNYYSNSKGKSSFDFDVKTTYIKDQFGNVTGTAKTYSYGDKYGGFENTEIRDNFGNKQGEIKTHKW